MNTNVDRLAMISVVGEVSHPKVGGSVYRVGQDGAVHVVPGTGGITYNVRVGSPAGGWKGDHLEPGASTRSSDSGDNGAYNTLACVGNPAKVVSGDAKGGEGYVVGTHGGIEHVMVEFPDAVLEELLPGDKILVKAVGQGLELTDFPGVAVRSLDPRLLHCWGIEPDGDTLAVPVTHTVPAKVMGSGLGANTAVRGDYDIQMFSRDVVDEYGLEDLKLGDFVAILDADHTYGRIYYTGAVSVGVIVHSDSYVAGHGPGVATVLTSREGKIRPVIDADANVATLYGRLDA
ncbi:DUF4438 domain-containing protein [Candidatus Poribacteria bacterium]|jgi:hypothetical protein|nr:DUF4438 domain-containing protein [Candidatus Poribacteria bacterium]MBT5537230.1 DUF4438 domain-containing protein [Candidatus Poribacteria bacterium]MBT5714460.1 DUF4438 domain-containing protein [Candidatus Poribacteria bacterium]MBT7101219.1 DUF4438 domain-containing protein [Candidatus Poribacteria bacterium]MBT7806255.1 DUF4438 domain-containing protein [Candidatus Poribacteria bacterium]